MAVLRDRIYYTSVLPNTRHNYVQLSRHLLLTATITVKGLLTFQLWQFTYSYSFSFS